jgi:TRAP-type C4-dicarboxylate transport system permease small subunit
MYAFAILLLVSAWLLALHVLNSPFLALDFEITVVYMPTAIAGIIMLYYVVRHR